MPLSFERRCLVLGALLLAMAAPACGTSAPVDPEKPRAILGVLFGGQVQERSSLDLGSTKSRLLFRVDRDGPAQLARSLEYQIVRPGPLGRRVTEQGTLVLRAGERRADQTIELQRTAPTGALNVRVSLDGRLLLDRAILLTRGSDSRL